MTMHLVRGMTSINTRKRRANKKPGHAQSQAKHDKWLMKMGVHPSQLKNKDKSSGASIPNYSTTRSTVPTSDRITPIHGKRKANVYSGEYITGLATLHKSNTVPVGKGDDPESYAQMRRN
mgnify:FL=1|tara:strand:- start:630 stop:989 length:360 start_codon:yes stop_codon:yes gene_type:complete